MASIKPERITSQFARMAITKFIVKLAALVTAALSAFFLLATSSRCLPDPAESPQGPASSILQTQAQLGATRGQQQGDPAAWGSNHAGNPVPDFVHGDECLFCHR